MTPVLTIATREIRDGIRNRWVVGSIVLLATLSMSLLLLGSAPVGNVKATQLELTVVSLSSLSVYLLPLIALTLSYDTVVGEVERGTLLLLLSYPVRRWQIILGKFLGQLVIVVSAVLVGYGFTGLVTGFGDGGGLTGAAGYLGMMATSILLGAVFLGIGLLISVLARERSAAIALAVGVWLVFVVLYDLALLSIVVNDTQHVLDPGLFSLLLLASPTDVYRLYNLFGTEVARTVSGMASISPEVLLDRNLLLLILVGWVALPVAVSTCLFQRKEL